jgi:hypothetical protein
VVALLSVRVEVFGEVVGPEVGEAGVVTLLSSTADWTSYGKLPSWRPDCSE